MNKKVLALSTAAALISIGTLGAVGTKLAMKPSAVAQAYYQATGDTFRIWLDRNNHYAGMGYSWVVSVGETFDSDNIYDAQWINVRSDLGYFGYFDLPISLIDSDQETDFWFAVRNDSSHSIIDGTYIPVNYVSGDNSLCYTIEWPASSPSYGLYPKLNPGKLTNEGVVNILAGYYSCSPNKDNGYGSFETLYSTWFYSSVGVGYGNVLDDLKNVSLSDYASTDDYESGGKNYSTNALDKSNFMLSLARAL